MKKGSIVFLFLLVMITLSCTKDNCSENVIPPQASIFIEVLDEDTDENVFTNETYTVADISVTEFDDTEVDFILITRDDLNLIQIFPKTNIALDNKIYLNIADDETIEIQYDVETNHTECYTQKRIINVNIPFYTFTEENQIFKIKI
jgi:hypothetical protein